MDKKDIKEILEDVSPEDRATAWELYVRNEVNSLLDTFLPEAISGNVGIKYDHPILKISPKTDKAEIDESKATGVFISISFEFAAPITFFDDKPEQVE